MAREQKTFDIGEIQKKMVLSPEEMAVYLGCSRGFAYRLLQIGAIPSSKVETKMVRVLRADIDVFSGFSLSKVHYRSRDSGGWRSSPLSVLAACEDIFH